MGASSDTTDARRRSFAKSDRRRGMKMMASSEFENSEASHERLLRLIGYKADAAPVETVDISSLVLQRSVRTAGVDEEHVRNLAGTHSLMPHITVQRSTMIVIDGEHRVHVASARGETVVRARFFDGDDREAFALAVKLNSSHGLPLSRKDRKAAVDRLLVMWPDWSNNTIGFFADVSPRWVAERRRCLDAGRWDSTVRCGRDGRLRPLNTAHQRRHAFQLFTDNPKATLREIANRTGLSVGTVRDVRLRYESGRDPVPARQRSDRDIAVPRPRAVPKEPADELFASPLAGGNPRRGRSELISHLRRDPALRQSQTGRFLLRALDPLALEPDGWRVIAEAVPAHLRETVAVAASECAELWHTFADATVRQKPFTVREMVGGEL